MGVMAFYHMGIHVERYVPLFHLFLNDCTDGIHHRIALSEVENSGYAPSTLPFSSHRRQPLTLNAVLHFPIIPHQHLPIIRARGTPRTHHGPERYPRRKLCHPRRNVSFVRSCLVTLRELIVS